MEDAIAISSSDQLVRQPLGLWEQTKKPALLAAVALVVGVIASRPRGARRSRGVFGTVAKGALYGALSALPQILLLRVSKKVLGPAHTVEANSAKLADARQ